MISTTTPLAPLSTDDDGFPAALVDALDASTLRERGSLKWTGFPGTIGAWVAEMDFPVAAPITRALQQAVADGAFGYLPPDLVARATQACADWYARTTSWRPDPSGIRLVPDVLAALRITLDHVTGPGTTAVVTTPAYMPFLTRPELVGHTLRTVEARQDADGRWEHDLDALDATLASIDGPALLVLCNPWNPVGRVLSRTELLAIADVVERHGATVFSDEIHAPVLLGDAPHVPYASLDARTATHTVTAVSASKAWNLPGLKCAQIVVTSPEHREILARPQTLAGYEAATIGLVANIAAYTEGEAWLDGARDYLRGNSAVLAEEIAVAMPDAHFSPPEGTYLAWVDLRDVRGGSGAPLPSDLGAFFRDRAGVALQDGAGCGQSGFVRINLALPRPLLRQSVTALSEAVRAH